MFCRVIAGAGLLAAAASLGGTAHAQAAAEEAVVLSGTSSGTGRASSELGNAISGSIGGATATIRTIPRSAPRGAPRRSRAGAVVVDGPLAADSDPLENTDAPAYQLSNGATIRVSGGMRNSASAKCKLNCPGEEQEPTPPEPAQEEKSEAELVETEAQRPEAETSGPD